MFYAAYLACQLRFDEFLKIKTDAITYSGLDSAFARCELSLAQMFLYNFDDAQDTLRETLSLFPNDRYMPCLHLAMLHEARGEFAEAAAAMAQISVSMPESTLPVGVQALMLGFSGNQSAAKAIYHQLKHLRQQGQTFIPASQLAVAAIGIHDYDTAVEWFTISVLTDRDPIMNWIAIVPFNRHIHHHPGFRNLVTNTMKLSFPNPSPCKSQPLLSAALR